MNKYDQYIKEYLTENKEVSLHRIGTFFLESVVTESRRKASRTQHTRYLCDRNVETTPALLEYAAQKLAKPKSLIESDFDSHLQQVAQFLNIGKVYIIQGVCSIKKNKQGVYELVAENKAAVPDTLEIAATEMSRTPLNFKNGSSGIKIFALLICILLLAGVIWGAYQYLSTQNKPAATVAATDTTQQPLPAADTSTTLSSSAVAAPQPAIGLNDSAIFRFIYEETVSRLRAATRTAQLKTYGHNAGFDSTDISSAVKKYQMFIRDKVTPADTLHIKDSLQRLFQRNIVIETDK